MKRSTKHGMNALFVTAVTIASVILINAIVTVIDTKVPLKLDMTHDKIYAFSEYTKEVLRQIEEEVTIYALYPPNTNSNQYITYAEEYLSKYEALSNKIKVMYVDPYTNPNFAKRYEQQGETINAGSIILECGEKTRVIDMNQLYTTSSYDGATSIDMEKKLTSAIINVTNRGADRRIYLSEGHNEAASSGLVAALQENGYTCDTVNLSIDGIPADAALLILSAPTKDISAHERDGIDAYLDEGGNVLFILETGIPNLDRLSAYLGEWGITPNGDYVVEGDEKHYFRMQNGITIPTPQMQAHAITNSLKNQGLIFLAPSAQSLSLDNSNVHNAILTPLLITTDNSWGKTNLTSSVFAQEAGDIQGPLTVAALSERQGVNAGKIMVLGSIQSIGLSSILLEPSYANGDFILNAIGYMIGEDNSSMQIRAKEISASRLTMNQSQIQIVWLVLQYCIPLSILIAGLFVWVKRRYR